MWRLRRRGPNWLLSSLVLQSRRLGERGWGSWGMRGRNNLARDGMKKRVVHRRRERWDSSGMNHIPIELREGPLLRIRILG